MDRNGRADIMEVPHRSSAGTPPAAEVLDLRGLLTRAHGRGIDPYSPRRPVFHELISVRSGALRCSVDFCEHVLAGGSWLWVRPGQIHRYLSDLAEAEGTVILFQPGFLSTATVEAARSDQHTWLLPTPTGADAQAVVRVLDLLEGECRRPTGLPPQVHIEVVRHLLAALVMRLAHLHGSQDGEGAGSETFRRFQQAVERDFARTHRVEDYASALGYSVRTLTRATRDTVGCGAKRFIADRVLLEAKRMLVHTDLPATAIGERLGFPGGGVFTKFFRLRAGEPPTAFRLSQRLASRT